MMLVLASNSPRRKQLLALGGWTFSVLPIQIDEKPRYGETPREYVLRLAEDKALAARSQTPPGKWIIAADTTVADQPIHAGQALQPVMLGKPEDAADARQMLRRLRGRTHQVLTSLVVLRSEDGAFLSDCCITDVTMRDYSDAEIEAYVASGDPFDKAGAYAIQHREFKPVQELRGCYANVMGLPLCLLVRMCNQLTISSPGQVQLACLNTSQEHCSITPEMV